MMRAWEKLGANRDQRVETVHLRHLQVHQRHVGMETSKLLDRFAPVRRFADEHHVGFIGDQPGNAVSQ
jgi:hypothetical protein